MEHFNPRSPCGERRTVTADRGTPTTFQSTLPVRGATVWIHCFTLPSTYFNPRPPCGGRHFVYAYTNGCFIRFQSTPPVRGATSLPRICQAPRPDFNPRPPCGGRRPRARPHRAGNPISIHAPRAGGDLCHRALSALTCYFNPRPPCGGRPCGFSLYCAKAEFQSTPPVRGATAGKPHSLGIGKISIHAPRAGGDYGTLIQIPPFFLFQSTPPVRGATESMPSADTEGVFQSTPPVRGATQVKFDLDIWSGFQSTPPVRGATGDKANKLSILLISIHAPRAGGRRENEGQGIHKGSISIHAPRAGGDC